ncbi:bacterio-opsin activator domain-containing protein [Halococcoides cellulosivorans]|uniref:PAS domain S-box protein n=1 Tax=Halococcoides cellulosivorans TaxID=1679096 RepID=A0A2R4X126_9EURY|nr:bacterio-opsin activator domain-containing protein [Halococcoides cellulosivorans]AWB27499.1 hypothetical protein HARCEL1_07145 [Halococcoides cellulosivorans]
MERLRSTPTETTGRDSLPQRSIARWVSIAVGLVVGLGWLSLGVHAGGEITSVAPLAIVGPVLLGATANWSDLDALIERVEQITEGDYDVTFDLDRDDEVGQLADALDEMTDRLAAREAETDAEIGYTEDLLDAIDDVFYVLDRDGGHCRWNQSFEDVTGYDHDEIEGHHPLRYFEGDTRETVAAALDRVFEDGSVRIEAPLQTADGESIPYEWVVNRLEAPDGTAVAAGIGRDVTARQATERERDRYARRFEAVFDDPNLLAAVLAPDGTLLDVNDNAMDRIDADRSAVIGASFWETPWWADDPAVQTEIREGIDRAAAGEYVEYEIHHEGPDIETYASLGTIRPVFDDGDIVSLVVSAHDVTERHEQTAELRERERELERTQDLLKQAERTAHVGGWELDVREEPYTFEATEEFYDIHGLSPDEPITPEEIIQLYDPDDQAYMERLLTAAIEEGERYDMEVRLDALPEGDRWIRSIAEPAVEDGRVVAVRGSLQDITDRKENERRFQTLHELARGVIEADSVQAMAELVLDAGVSVLGPPCIAVYLFDEETGRLEPAAVSEPFERVASEPTAGYDPRAGDLLWEAYASGEVVTADDRALDGTQILTSAVNCALLVPIGEHGVLLAATDDADVRPDDRRLAETLAATMATALSRLESDAALQDKQRQLEAQNRRLRRQIQITETIRRINRSLVGSRTREEIESAVCERLVESGDTVFAWIGSLDDGSLVPRVWAGEGHAYLDAVSLSTDAPTPDPSVQAATDGEPVVVRSVVDNVTNEAWRKHALVEEFASLVAVPLEIDEHSYGVLTVYATEAGAFGDLERRIFEELGENIANAIRALEAFRALYTDEFVELRLRLDREETFLGRVAAAADATVEYVGLASRPEDASPLFFEVEDADPAAMADVLDELHAVREYRQIGGDEGRTLFEATVAGTVCAARLVEYGGVPRSIGADGDEIEVVVDVPVGTDVREFVDMIRERHPSVELLARKNVTRDAQTRQELVAGLFEGLTDRQLAVLRTAFFAGFFEWPRESTGQEVADLLDVSQPTVNRHLRHALRALLEQLFEEEPTTVAPT